jgi:hypothetical protein
MTSPTDSEPDDVLLALMKRDGIPITRENYLHIAYFGDIPEPWGAELEANLPVQLQDWSQFERVGPLPPERRRRSRQATRI